MPGSKIVIHIYIKLVFDLFNALEIQNKAARELIAVCGEEEEDTENL